VKIPGNSWAASECQPISGKRFILLLLLIMEGEKDLPDCSVSAPFPNSPHRLIVDFLISFDRRLRFVWMNKILPLPYKLRGER
jgi:hypothetical protein